jgi:hypothetical protein
MSMERGSSPAVRALPAGSVAFLSALSLLTFVPRASAAPYEVETVANGGRIAGRVTLSGTPPSIAPIKTTKNQDYCGMTIANPLYEGKGGGLANVEVYLKNIDKGKAKPSSPITLTNTHCMFSPRVQGAVVGQQVKIVSDDPILHNTHPQIAETNATLYNVALPFKGFSVVKPLLPQAGLVRVKCDVHEWMRAWIVELDHPYFATTDESGNFEIGDVPPGTYTVVAWHEVMGEKTGTATVVAGKAASLNFQFTAK